MGQGSAVVKAIMISTIGAIDTQTVSLVHYTAGIISWRKDELEAVDRKTGK